MVKLTVTAEVNRHKVNQDYKCLLVELLSDERFQFLLVQGRVVKANWMPTDDDVIDMCQRLVEVSPTFKQKLVRLVDDFYIQRSVKKGCREVLPPIGTKALGAYIPKTY